MKRLLLPLIILAGLLGGALLVKSQTFAVDISSPACDADPKPAICADIEGGNAEGAANPLFGPNGILTEIIFVVSLVGAVIAVIVIIVAGTKLTLSGGNSDKIAKARSQIIYAVVGLIVAVIAQALVQFVLTKIT